MCGCAGGKPPVRLRADLVERVSPAVVTVTTEQEVNAAANLNPQDLPEPFRDFFNQFLILGETFETSVPWNRIHEVTGAVWVAGPPHATSVEGGLPVPGRKPGPHSHRQPERSVRDDREAFCRR